MESVLWVAAWAAEACFPRPAPLLAAFTSLYPLGQVDLHVWMGEQKTKQKKGGNIYVFALSNSNHGGKGEGKKKRAKGIRIQLELNLTLAWIKEVKYLILPWIRAFWHVCVCIIFKKRLINLRKKLLLLVFSWSKSIQIFFSSPSFFSVPAVRTLRGFTPTAGFTASWRCVFFFFFLTGVILGHCRRFKVNQVLVKGKKEGKFNF